MKVLALLSVFLALPVAAQVAKVIELSPEDAATAKSLFDQSYELAKRETAFREKIHDKYLTVEKESGTLTSDCTKLTNQGFIEFAPCNPPLPKPKATKVKVSADGWSYGYEYSEDFRFIVPKQPDVKSNGCISWPNTFTTNPVSWCGSTICAGTTPGTFVNSTGNGFNIGSTAQ